MGLVFFKINKHKKYNYKPVFYDPNKEEQNDINSESEVPQNPEIERFKSNIKKQWHRQKKSRSNKYSNTTIALVLALLLAMAYLLFK